MKNILIVGAGGIGSWLAMHLYDLKTKDQLMDTRIKFVDNDTVDSKNLRYQNFKVSEISDLKAECVANRYGFEYENIRIENDKYFKEFDCIISAVDNAKFRKLLFTYVFKKNNNSTFWIDLRSEGRMFSAYTKNKINTKDKMLKSLPDSEENGSCQLQFELENNILQLGNKIVSAIGAQLILNYLRNEPMIGEISHVI